MIIISELSIAQLHLMVNLPTVRYPIPNFHWADTGLDAKTNSTGKARPPNSFRWRIKFLVWDHTAEADLRWD